MTDKQYELLKRTFDITAAGTAVAALSPVFLAAALGIELSDPGPVFYVADRVGKNNRHFKMYKFRSMRVDRNADEKSLRADKNRIFPFGQFMRDTKIDELPQLFNVLKGDMSVIGPRPAAADQVETTRAGKYAETSKVKPGLSGPSALYDYIYGDTVEDEEEYERLVLKTRLDLDLFYLKARSAGYDMKMVADTISCILYKIAKKEPKKILDQLLKAARSVADE